MRCRRHRADLAAGAHPWPRLRRGRRRPRWVLHCGDSFFHHGTVDGTAAMARALAAFESVVAFDRKMVRQNHARLVQLYRRREPDLCMVSSHDRRLYEQAKATA